VLARFLTPQRYVERETIFCKDDPPTGFFFVESGSVWLLNDDLTEPLYLTAGDIFGHEATTYRHPHLYTAQAAEESVVWLLSPADYEKLEHVYPSVKFTFTGNLVNRLGEDFELAVEVLAAECDALQIVAGSNHPLVKNLERAQRTLLWAKHCRL
jgi:CRP-like cAMP-binding protein